MSNYKLNESFINRTEIKRAMWFARQQFPNCRAGQAFCNIYLKARATWPEVYYEEDQGKAVDMIVQHFLAENRV